MIMLKENELSLVNKNEIPQLDDNNIIYLKDIISLNDIVWTFCIIDYYLDYLGYGLSETYHLSV